MTYIPRLVEPTPDNINYYSNINPLYRDGYPMPNCTCYAIGRWIEILGYVPKLCLGNAGRWYTYSDEYERGNIPRQGAIACWGLNDSNIDGHVAVVEEIKDNSIICSNSAYKSTNFYIKEYYGNYNFGNYVFKGFIYLPHMNNDKLNIKKEVVGGNLYFVNLNWHKENTYQEGTLVIQISNDIYSKWGYKYVMVEVDNKIGYMALNYLKDYI